MKLRPSVVLDTGARTMVPTLVLVSLYLLVMGHNAPGGGFVGGLVAGTALLISFLSRGEDGVARLVPAHPVLILGTGLSLALAAGITGLFAGAAFLDALQATIEAPVLGTVKLNTALAFDLGVYLVVVGLVALVLRRLAQEEQP
jgi:multicomponent Na+:H+ antiporter subunit A